MFVAPGARAAVKAARSRRFEVDYIDPLLAEAAKLGITVERVIDTITKKGEQE
jgi:hypothetical protein